MTFKKLSDLPRKTLGTEWSLRYITDYKGRKGSDVSLSASLPDELNTFYARFETSNTFPAVKLPADHDTCPLVLTTPEVSRAFKRVNARKAPGLDGIHGHVLRACAVQLADVFTNIFNLSLRLTVIPTCFKQTTIILVPKKNNRLLPERLPPHITDISHHEVLRTSSQIPHLLLST